MVRRNEVGRHGAMPLLAWELLEGDVSSCSSCKSCPNHFRQDDPVDSQGSVPSDSLSLVTPPQGLPNHFSDRMDKIEVAHIASAGFTRRHEA